MTSFWMDPLAFYRLLAAAVTLGMFLSIILFLLSRHQQRLALRALEASVKQLTARTELNDLFLVATPVGVAAYDGVSGACIQANKALSEMLGISLPDLLSGNFRTQPLWRTSELLTAAEETLTSARPYRGEFHIPSQNRPDTWLLCSFVRTWVRNTPHLFFIAEDITDRRRLETDLRRQIDFLNVLIETIPGPVFSKDAHGIYIGCNSAFEYLTGMSRTEIIGKTVFELSPGEEAGNHHRMDQDLIQRGGSQMYESVVRSKTRGSREAVFFKAAYRGPDGSIAGLVGIILDITDRKRVENELFKSRQHFKDLVSAVDGIVWEADLHTLHYTFVSLRAEQVLGYPAEQWLAEPDFWLEHLHPEDREQALEERKSAVLEQRAHEMEYRMIAHGNRIVWVRDVVTTVNDSDHTTYLRGVITDITGHKHAEQDIHRYVDIVNAMPVGLHVYRLEDLTDDHSLRMIMANEAAQLFSGYDSKKILGRTIDDNFPDLRRRGITGIYADVALTGKPAGLGELFIQDAPAGPVWFFVEAIPLPDHCVAILFQNITRLKETELALRDANTNTERVNHRLEQAFAHANELAAAAAAASMTKSEFLANISHEIRTPLNAVTGLLELTLDTHITDTQKDYIVTALASADSLIRLINDILDFSKIEAHQVRIETRPFSLLDELNMAIRPFAIQAEAKGIIFECSRGPDLPVMVLGDSLRLRQILNNLLSNAIKFTDHGSIVLSVQRSLASAHETDWFDFRIQDSGIGIHPNQANRVFEAFTQADGSISRKYGGTGLGLTISRRLAELMGGQLTVQSQPGVGSAFLLHIPLHTSHPADALESPGHDVDSSIEASLMRGPKLNVLVADDDAINQRLVSARLNALGWKVTLVSNGRNAVDIIPSASFDLVMMDVNMPEMDGLTAARNIRTFETSFSRPPVPIIAMTAFVTDQDRANCMQAGMDDYLAKPVTRRDILSTIQRVLLRHRTPQAHPETLNTAPEGIPSMDPATLSRARALEITDGDSSLLVELTDVFLSDTPDLMQSLRRAVHDVQTNDVRHLAHKIKGMLGAIGADSGSAVAADLERAARHEQTGFYPEGLRRLESIMETLGRIMRTPEWRGTVNPPP